MSRYSATWETVAGVQLAVLRDAATNAEVRVAPSLGNTCIAYRLGDWHILDEPPNEHDLLTRASSYGIPILFPWPNRLRNARFTFEGREYRVLPSPGTPHANHGLVRNRPWQISRCEVTGDAPLVESVIRSTDFPELADQYPSAFELTVAYRLQATALRIDALATNTGPGRLPFGFGLHPYFPVPLAPGSRRASCQVRVRASEAWELVDHLPTGQRRAVDGRDDLRRFRPLGAETYDDVLTALEQPFAAELRDPVWEGGIVVEADTSFRECVVFAPEHRPVVALEPYTCTADALNLAARGIDAGPRVLQPGESWHGRVAINPRQR